MNKKINIRLNSWHTVTLSDLKTSNTTKIKTIASEKE